MHLNKKEALAVGRRQMALNVRFVCVCVCVFVMATAAAMATLAAAAVLCFGLWLAHGRDALVGLFDFSRLGQQKQQHQEHEIFVFCHLYVYFVSVRNEKQLQPSVRVVSE